MSCCDGLALRSACGGFLYRSHYGVHGVLKGTPLNSIIQRGINKEWQQNKNPMVRMHMHAQILFFGMCLNN